MTMTETGDVDGGKLDILEETKTVETEAFHDVLGTMTMMKKVQGLGETMKMNGVHEG